MSDLIDRRAALEAVCMGCCEGRKGCKFYPYCDCLTPMRELPAIEPQTAHWIIDGHHIQCSQCGETMCNTDREGDPIPRNFCPNCGVRMVTE